MASKKILFEAQAREALRRGVDTVADAVKVTLGPRGRNVILAKGFGGPMITNDGVTIAKEVELKDPFENMGAEIIKEVANKTNDIAGDGTTTATILTQAMMREGLRHTTMGVNAMGVRSGIEAAAKDAVEALKALAKPVKGNDDIKQVATISAESAELGTIIADTIEKVGKDGVVTVEESQSIGVDSDVVEGLQFDKGYVSPYMITNTERMEAEYKEVAMLVTDQKISSIKDILPLLEGLAQSGTKDLVIVAEDIDGEALTTFVLNKLRGGFNVLAVKAPGFGDRKKALLEDIAVTVGATVVSKDTGLKLESATASVLGRARRVVSNKDKTIIVGGKGRKGDIDARVAQLRTELQKTDSKFEKEKLQERIGKLSGGVAVIRVGAATETEMKYLKLKIEDAVNATRAAIDEGVVPGGGSALVKVAEKLGLKEGADEMALGYNVVIRALSEPLRQIARNAGKDDGAVVAEHVAKGGKNAGYNAAKDEIVEDMLKEGIIDPVKVTRSAVQHAASAVAILLTTEVAIADDIEEKKHGGGHEHGMGDMGY